MQNNVYEIFGLDSAQVDSLSERFGDAVVSTEREEGTLRVKLSNADVTNLAQDGLFIKSCPTPN